MNRTTLISIGIFAVLAVAFFATREKEVSVGIRKFSVPKVTPESISSIELSGAQNVKLSKENSIWFVSDLAHLDKKFIADERTVKSTLDALADFKAPDFVTEKNEKQTEFEIDAAKGLTLKASGASAPIHLVLGKAGKNGGTYVRLATSPEIFSTQSGLSYFVRKDVNAWRKKTIGVGKSEDVVKVKVTHADGEIVQLSNETSTWKLDSPVATSFRFDSNEAKNIANFIAGLTAQGFADSESLADLQLQPPAAIVEIEMKEGKKSKLEFGTAHTDGNRALRVEGDPQIYFVSDGQFEGLAKRIEDLRDLSLMNFDVSKVTRLEISSGSKKAVLQKESSTWKLLDPKSTPAGFEFDPSQVGVQLQRILSIRGTKMASGISDAAAGILKPSVLIELSFEDKTKQQLRFGQQGREEYVKGSLDSLLYATTSAQRMPYENPVELFKKPPPAPDWANAQGLEQLPPEIRQQLEAQMRQQPPH